MYITASGLPRGRSESFIASCHSHISALCPTQHTEREDGKVENVKESKSTFITLDKNGSVVCAWEPCSFAVGALVLHWPIG